MPFYSSGFGQTKKKATLTSQEKGALQTLVDHGSCHISLRPSGGIGSSGVYCLYTADRSPICTWPRGVIDGLVMKLYIDLTKETGVFVIL